VKRIEKHYRIVEKIVWDIKSTKNIDFENQKKKYQEILKSFKKIIKYEFNVIEGQTVDKDYIRTSSIVYLKKPLSSVHTIQKNTRFNHKKHGLQVLYFSEDEETAKRE